MFYLRTWSKILAFGCLTTISKIKIKVKKALWKKMDDNIILKWYGSKPVRREWNEIIQSLLYNSYKITINFRLCVCVCVWGIRVVFNFTQQLSNEFERKDVYYQYRGKLGWYFLCKIICSEWPTTVVGGGGGGVGVETCQK